MPRRFITKQDIDEYADAGTTVVELDDRVTVTDLAREHARDRGVRLVAGQGAADGSRAAAPASPGPEPAAEAPRDRSGLHGEVRSAVIAAVGTVPDGLDAAIARVLARE